LSLLTGQLQEKIVDFFFPRRCVGCGKMGDFLCPGCRQKLPLILPPICKKCGKPESSGSLCSACWGQKTEIDGVRSVFRFEGTIRQAIHDFKYRNLRSISDCLAMLMADYLKNNPVNGETLVPVPLHPRRLRARGYNQSSLLAQKLGKLIDVPVIDGSLCRLKDSLPQARTTAIEERRDNVKEAFGCHDEELKAKNVILVDDVCTSGATLEACAAALKADGAISVVGLTLAREI
jgi:competence protein ComFC